MDGLTISLLMLYLLFPFLLLFSGIAVDGPTMSLLMLYLLFPFLLLFSGIAVFTSAASSKEEEEEATLPEGDDPFALWAGGETSDNWANPFETCPPTARQRSTSRRARIFHCVRLPYVRDAVSRRASGIVWCCSSFVLNCYIYIIKTHFLVFYNSLYKLNLTSPAS